MKIIISEKWDLGKEVGEGQGISDTFDNLKGCMSFDIDLIKTNWFLMLSKKENVKKYIKMLIVVVVEW